MRTFVAAAQNRTVTLEVRFSPPPGASRVVGIARAHRQNAAPLTQADYAASLIDKYGTPSVDVSNGEQGNRIQRTLKWRDTRARRAVDVAGAAQAEQAAQEWVRSLEAEASRPGTQAPAL